MINFKLLNNKQAFRNNKSVLKNNNVKKSATTDFTFLTDEQVFDHKKLDILIKYSTKCAITDFAILLGGYASPNEHTIEGNALKDRTGLWWTQSSDGEDNVFNVFENGTRYWDFTNHRMVGARPALPFSSIQSMAKNIGINSYDIKEVQFGEYPQTIVDANYSRELDKAYNIGSLVSTGKNYTTDSIIREKKHIGFTARTHTEYEYKGSKYIRFVGDSICAGEILSDGRYICNGKIYWIRVEPITWLVDEKANIALSKKLLFSGIQFQNQRDYNGDFENTDIKQFMDNNFSKDIKPSKILSQTSVQKQTQNFKKNNTIRNQNPYDFNFNEVSEEDIIKGTVESNVSVFLHGRSSEGKSARVKQLDPDCEIIYMSNATPDSLNGKSVYNAATGEMIDVPPTWYSKVKEKCEAEPNKIHIIFFDELTNALPSIQGMAFNIVLEGEVNGKWKLPLNARIVAAGNDLNDSLAANQMAEPMFNRFAHVYINTTVDSWLKWASTPKEKYERLDFKEEEIQATIHPAIYAYVAYKSYSGHDVLRTPYTGDKPNADPRKWEMASKVLYKTKHPEMLRALIGEDLTKDFTAFVSQPVISVEDVIKHNYSDNDLEMDVSQKFATAVGLSSVSEEHFEIVRDFMKKVGAEPRALFETIWTHGDEKRLDHLLDVQITDNLSQGGKKR